MASTNFTLTKGTRYKGDTCDGLLESGFCFGIAGQTLHHNGKIWINSDAVLYKSSSLTGTSISPAANTQYNFYYFQDGYVCLYPNGNKDNKYYMSYTGVSKHVHDLEIHYGSLNSGKTELYWKTWGTTLTCKAQADGDSHTVLPKLATKYPNCKVTAKYTGLAPNMDSGEYIYDYEDYWTACDGVKGLNDENLKTWIGVIDSKRRNTVGLGKRETTASGQHQWYHRWVVSIPTTEHKVTFSLGSNIPSGDLGLIPYINVKLESKEGVTNIKSDKTIYVNGESTQCAFITYTISGETSGLTLNDLFDLTFPSTNYPYQKIMGWIKSGALYSKISSKYSWDLPNGNSVSSTIYQQDTSLGDNIVNKVETSVSGPIFIDYPDESENSILREYNWKDDNTTGINFDVFNFKNYIKSNDDLNSVLFTNSSSSKSIDEGTYYPIFINDEYSNSKITTIIYNKTINIVEQEGGNFTSQNCDSSACAAYIYKILTSTGQMVTGETTKITETDSDGVESSYETTQYVTDIIDKELNNEYINSTNSLVENYLSTIYKYPYEIAHKATLGIPGIIFDKWIIDTNHTTANEKNNLTIDETMTGGVQTLTISQEVIKTDSAINSGEENTIYLSPVFKMNSTLKFILENIDNGIYYDHKYVGKTEA